MTAPLLGVAARKASRRSVVAGRDDAPVAHEHRADVTAEALGALPRRDREQHEVLLARGTPRAQVGGRGGRVSAIDPESRQQSWRTLPGIPPLLQCGLHHL